jgi:hypothetical protein
VSDLPAPLVPPKSKGGRPRKHGFRSMRDAIRRLGTGRLDQRSKVAVAVRTWKAEIRADLGNDLTRAQETILEIAAQDWLLLSSLDDYLARQPTLVNTRARSWLPVMGQRLQLAESLARMLDRLGYGRKSKPVQDIRRMAGLPG